MSPAPLRPMALVLLLALAARGQEPTLLGRVQDCEGQVARRPVGAPRWELAEAGQPLGPGERVKTGARGANALRLSLASGAGLVLGPGAQVELVDGGAVRVHAGEVAVVPRAPGDGPAAAVKVLGPRQGERQVAARTVLRAGKDGALEALSAEPRWLAGYEAQEAQQGALGALLATVDGRDVPLTIGYHRVTVDVRDQIARTVVEESFQNHTGSVLEGVFYFPLPAEASISGFSMWIGDEQVHGEVVEKERARAIYETILREKRDPGLLEWAGGSLFKARVYPIGAEKRIQLSYTQVLPRVREADGSSTWVYRYPLESDALRQHPLEKLELAVTVSSTRPLREVTCPSHPARVERTEHAARVEHSAEQVRAARDLEVRVTTAPPVQPEAGALTCVPHRRGDDGYFLLLVDTPPAPEAELLATRRAPLELLVLCDTSGSIDERARVQQERFVAALLESLGEQDSFNLVTCDVTAEGVFPRPQKATPALIETALGKLAARQPMGWTDLDRALEVAAELKGPETRVVYVGDGAPTTGDADAGAFAQRAAERWAGGPVHVVVPGAGLEPLGVEGLARLGGGGTLRSLAGADPTRAAAELLRDLVSPLVRGVEVRVEGVETAAVYPRQVRALPAGSQQVVVGRFDPRGPTQRGAVLVAGKRGATPFRLVSAFEVPPASEDPDAASFVPRLWARRQLDHLLEQGSGPAVRERVIALSEDFQLLTPYTSFLVLESDADRARFQVQKRLRMRDGEELFQAARQGAEAELARAQAQKARSWRRAERARALAALEDLARDLTLRLGPSWQGDRYLAAGYGEELMHYARALPPSGGAPAPILAMDERAEAKDDAGAEAGGEDEAGQDASEEGEADEPAAEPSPETPDADKPAAQPAESKQNRMERSRRAAGSFSFDEGPRGGRGGGGRPARPAPALLPPEPPAPAGAWLDALLTKPGGPLPPAVDPAGWPPEALALIAKLDRAATVRALPAGAGLRITVQHEAIGPDGALRPAGESTFLLGSERWVHRFAGSPAGEEVHVEWLLPGAEGKGGQRGAISLSWLLGSARPAEAGDAAAWPSPFPWALARDLAGFAGWRAEVAPGRLVLHAPDGQTRWALQLDPGGTSLVSVAGEGPGQGGATTYAEPVQVAGASWPGVVSVSDAQGQVASRLRLTVEQLAPPAFAAALEEALAPRAQALILGPCPAPRTARAALAAGQDAPEVRWALLGWLGERGRWSEAWPHLEALAAAHPGRPGLIPVRTAALSQGRRLEELRAHLDDGARALSAAPRPAVLAAARSLADAAQTLGSGEEQLALLDRLRPVVEAAQDPETRLAWDQRGADALERADRPEEALARRRELVKRHPGRLDLALRLAGALASLGDTDGALAVLRACAVAGPRRGDALALLQTQGVHLLWQAERWSDAVSEVERLEREGRPDAQVLGLRLEALGLLDREPEAWAWAREVLGALEGQAAWDEALAARAQAALGFALGRTAGRWGQELAPESGPFLLAAGRALFRRGPEAEPVLYLLQSWQLLRSPIGRTLAGELHARLQAEGAALAAPELARLATWAWRLDAGRGELHPGAADSPWRALGELLLRRWREARAAGDAPGAAALEALLDQEPVGEEPALVFLRERLAAGGEPGLLRAHAAALLGRLGAGEWKEAREAEAWGLLPRLLAGATEPEVAREAALDAAVLALHGLVDWACEARARAAVAALPEVNTLPRKKLRAAGEAALREARQAVRARLGGLDLPGLEDWLRIEGAWLEVMAGGAKGREAARETAEGLLLRLVPSPRADLRTRVLLARALATRLWLLLDEPLAERAAHGRELLARLDRAREARDPRLDWQEATWLGLLALDLPDELLTRLEGWTADPARGPDWARRRAWLLVDRDRLAEAAAQLQALAEQDEADAGDLEQLAQLHLALGQAEPAERARARAWALRPEWEISQWLWEQVQRVSRQGEEVPEPLDPQVPLAITALLRQAAHPAQHQWVVRQLYQTTRDPRVLEGLADAVPGHSPGRLYALFQAYADLLAQVQEEATVDAVVRRVRALRERAGTPLDRRGLDLLGFLLSRAAAAQGQGGEPHAARALDALKAAFPGPLDTGPWAPGEAVRYAELVAAWAPLQPAALNEELLRQLHALAGGAGPGSDERLRLTGSLARALHASGRAEAAARALGAAVAHSAQARGGALPPHLWSWALELTGWLQELGEHRPAEALLEEQLRLAAAAGFSPGRRNPLTRALHALRVNGLAQGAALRQGSGRALLEAELAGLREELAAPGPDSLAVAAMQDVFQLLRAAHGVDGLRERAAELAGELARSDLPRLLAARQHRPAQSLLGAAADLLEQLRSPVDALELLVVAVETQPAALRRRRADAWAQEDWRLADLRRKAGAALPGPLAARLLQATLVELARRLEQGEEPPVLCHVQSDRGWPEQTEAFLATAREVLTRGRDRAELVVHVAEWLEQRLGRAELALEALLAAEVRGVLGFAGRDALAGMLERAGRWGEAVPLLEALLAARSEDLELRCRLLVAAHRAGDAARRDAVLAAALSWLGEARRRHEGELRRLARACLEAQLPARAEPLLREALALHGRGAPVDGDLGELQADLARACAGQGKTAAAVEAASGAVVAWGRHREQRARMLGVLEEVLQAAPDLDAWLRGVDAEEARSGLVNPTLRRAVARVLRRQGDPAGAERQLVLALEAAPDDAESLALRVELLDARGDRAAEAAAAQLALARHLARDPAPWRALGDRLQALGRGAEAERAWTQLAELSPHESEGHQALAEVRQAQSRWAEAAVQWRQVARVREREPHGWLGLLRCLLEQGAREEAAAVARRLREGPWGERAAEVERELPALEERLRR